MAELNDAEKRDLADAASDAVRRSTAQATVTAALKSGCKVKLAVLDDACSADPVSDRLDFKGKLVLAGLLER
jgi:hypothetical protein